MKILQKLIFLTFILIPSFHIIAQEKNNATFEKVEYASYYVNPNQKDKVELSSFTVIDKNGVATVHLNGNRGVKFYSYQLSDTIMKELHRLLSGKNQLKKNVIETKMKPGYFYGGNYDFIRLKTKNKTESMCFVEPYMSTEFNTVYKKIRSIILKQSSEAETSDPKFNINDIEKRILEEHNESTYLPLKQMPPPRKKQ